MHQDFSLTTFDNHQTPSGVKIDLRLHRKGNDLMFKYRVSGSVLELSSIKWPDERREMAARRDELWKTTVFEFFVAVDGQAGYIEMNIAPSGDWNAYAFSNYRAGMLPVASIAKTPLSSTSKDADSLALEGVIHLSDFQLVGPVVLGASAVLEYQDGRKEYWALAHRGEKPDFHLRDSFTAHV